MTSRWRLPPLRLVARAVADARHHSHHSIISLHVIVIRVIVIVIVTRTTIVLLLSLIAAAVAQRRKTDEEEVHHHHRVRLRLPREAEEIGTAAAAAVGIVSMIDRVSSITNLAHHHARGMISLMFNF